jgi:hypothetical protein
MEKQHNMLKKPSFWSLLITSILILYILIKLIRQNKNQTEDPMHLVKIILITVMFGIHGILHLGLEKVYNYNPLETGKLF